MGAWTRYGCPTCGTTLNWPTGPGWGIACHPCNKLYPQAELDSLPLSAFKSWRLLHLASEHLIDVACRTCSAIGWDIIDDLLKDGWLPWGGGAEPQTWTCVWCNAKQAMAHLGGTVAADLDAVAASFLFDEPPPPPDPEVMEAVIETLKEPEPGITES